MDMHTHILPGLDDGSQSMDCTRNMLRQAYDEGVRVIVATPHFGIRNTGFKLAEAEEVLRETQKVADEITPGLKLLLGNELFYTEGVFDSLDRGEARTIGGSSYALVEFSTRDSYEKICQCIRKCTWAGYRPLIAHIERYRCLEGDVDAVRSLVEQGAVIQVNCRSFMDGVSTGKTSADARDGAGTHGDAQAAADADSSTHKRHGLFGLGRRNREETKSNQTGFFLEQKGDWVRTLLAEGLVHLIASDCHDDEFRSPVYRSALEAMQGYATEEQLLDITRNNVIKLIRNEKIV